MKAAFILVQLQSRPVDFVLSSKGAIQDVP